MASELSPEEILKQSKLPDAPPMCTWALDKSKCGPCPHRISAQRFDLPFHKWTFHSLRLWFVFLHLQEHSPLLSYSLKRPFVWLTLSLFIQYNWWVDSIDVFVYDIIYRVYAWHHHWQTGRHIFAYILPWACFEECSMHAFSINIDYAENYSKEIYHAYTQKRCYGRRICRRLSHW